MPRLIIAAGIAVLWAGNAHAAGPTHDGQAWGEVDIVAAPAPNWTITATAVLRGGSDVPDPSVWGGGLTIDRRIGPVTVTIGDLAVETRSPATGARRFVDLPLAAATLTRRFGRLTLSDRNRFEQLRGVPGEPWRYRNRLLAEYPLRRAGPITSVFASEELFWSLDTARLQRSRRQIGLGLRGPAGTELKLYYLRQDDRAGTLRSIDALGVALTVSLGRRSRG